MHNIYIVYKDSPPININPQDPQNINKDKGGDNFRRLSSSSGKIGIIMNLTNKYNKNETVTKRFIKPKFLSDNIIHQSIPLQIS